MKQFENECDAKSAGEKVLSLLKNNNGWKVNVWNNLGWCFDLSCGAMSLSYDSNGEFTAFLSDDINQCGGGASHWFDGTSDKDPNKVIRLALDNANEYMRKASNAINSVNI